ncbi:MAG TPA: amidohydrolase family protein, partial [Gemmatimonadales bacterium]
MSDRRAFIVTTGSASLGLTRIPALLGLRKDADLVIRSGMLFDGTGAAGVEADIALTAGKISAIGRRLSVRGAEEIDARGLAVAPGFIDIHSHADSNLADDPRAESIVRQGITTVVVGADGDSDATGSPAHPFSAYWT